MNPVLPSPWTYKTPRGSDRLLKKINWSRFNKNYKIKLAPRSVPPPPKQQKVEKDHMLHYLNRSTLMLTFPNIRPNEIESVLFACKNNLSEAINTLRYRDRLYKNKKNLPKPFNDNVQKENYPTLPKTMVQSKSTEYIPTKYTDVEIVQVRNLDNKNLNIVEVNNDILKMLQTCKTTIHAYSPSLAQCSISSTPPLVKQSSLSELSPTTTLSSTEIANPYKVYDFAEDEPISYHLPKPKRKPPHKVGIILKKVNSKYTVKLL